MPSVVASEDDFVERLDSLARKLAAGAEWQETLREGDSTMTAKLREAIPVLQLLNELMPPVAEDTPVPPALGGYRIVEKLAAGGMGIVYRARDEKAGRDVAVKVIHPRLVSSPEHRARFLREARLVAGLDHENIVHLLAVGEEQDCLFFVMPLLDGETLAERLKRGPLPTNEVVAVARQICKGLAAAHGKGVIHRDIKPSNVWLEERPEGLRVRLLDFGLATAPREESGLTLSGTVLGTPAYMSPEQAAAESAEARSDLFALGSVIYHMATGQPPFTSAMREAVLWSVRHQEPVPIAVLNPGLPGWLVGIIEQLLKKRPKDRPESALHVLRALEEEAPKRRTPPRRWIVVAAALVAAAIVASWLLLRRDPEAVPPGQEEVFPVAKQGPPIVNSLGMQLVHIPPGTFWMGSPEDEEGRNPDEVRHVVEITGDFYMGAFEVTRGEYERVTKKKLPLIPDDPKLPADPDRDGAMNFCLRLSERPEEKEAGRKYRLPTEAEWEYACRAGTTTPFSFGKTLSGKQANFDTRSPYGVGMPMETPIDSFARVGLFPPNAWGLHDMHGNAPEWVVDFYRSKYYRGAPRNDPPGPVRGDKEHGIEMAVTRGGSWSSRGVEVRSAARGKAGVNGNARGVGFRVVCEVEKR